VDGEPAKMPTKRKEQGEDPIEEKYVSGPSVSWKAPCERVNVWRLGDYNRARKEGWQEKKLIYLSSQQGKREKIKGNHEKNKRSKRLISICLPKTLSC